MTTCRDELHGRRGADLGDSALTLVLVVLVWWAAVLTVRTLRARGEDG